MNNTLCSIIIPYYNVPEELVNKCLSSIINQNWGETLYEVIFINDGSIIPISETTKQLFAKISHFTLIEQKNQGLSSARNIGIRVSKGKYIFFMDPDDYWFDFSVDQLFPFLNYKKYDIVKYLSQHIFNPTSHTHTPKVSTKVMSFNSGCEYLAENNIIKGACTYCFRRDFLIQANIYMPNGIIHEDEYFLTQAFFFAKEIVLTNIPLYAYIKRDGSITSIKTPQQWHKSLNDFFQTLKLTADYKDLPQNTITHEQALNNRMSYLICDYIFNIFNSTLSKCDKQKHLLCLQEIGYYPLPTLSNNLKYNLLKLFSLSYSTMLVWAKTISFINKLRPQNQNY